jgi:hypothetical protein
MREVPDSDGFVTVHYSKKSRRPVNHPCAKKSQFPKAFDREEEITVSTDLVRRRVQEIKDCKRKLTKSTSECSPVFERVLRCLSSALSSINFSATEADGKIVLEPAVKVRILSYGLGNFSSSLVSR